MKYYVDTEKRKFFSETDQTVEFENLVLGDEIYIINTNKLIKTIGKKGRPTNEWVSVSLIFSLGKKLCNKADDDKETQKIIGDSQIQLFLNLAKPDNLGVSRTVYISEFVGKYTSLMFSNGRSWCRDDGILAKTYNLIIVKNDKNSPHFDANFTTNKIIGIKLNGFYSGEDKDFSNVIDPNIRKILSKQECVFSGSSHQIEIDHKNGRKNEARVMEGTEQKLTDFQPVSRPFNILKRSVCKKCSNDNKRYDAKKLGYCVSVVYGIIDYEDSIGCKGCYFYDPKEFRSKLIIKEEVTDENTFSI
jgi:hypothetical protein